MTTFMSTRSSIGGGRTSFCGVGDSLGGRMSSGSMHGGAGGSSVKISRGTAYRSFSSGGGAGFGGGAGSAAFGGGAGYGGGGGGGSGPSSCFGFGFGAGGGAGGGAGMDESLIGNEKLTMQNLNDRLASYLTNVHSLEKANAELELKIRQFLESKTGPAARDYSAFFVTIADLQDKILVSLLERTSMLLGIDNARLAGDDFRVKYENELAMRQSVEADIAGLRGALGDLDQAKRDLSIHIEGLMEELDFLKKNHEENMLAIRTKVGGTVTVEVDAAPQENMMDVMEEIRNKYEAMALKSQKDMEAWFQTKVEGIKTEVASQELEMATTTTNTKEVKSQMHALEIELQAQLSMKASLEATLVDTGNSFAMMLGHFQNQVTVLEEKLMQLRADLGSQSQEYQMLLHIKIRLEMEIAEYRRLLDGEGISTAGYSSSAVLVKTVTVEGGGQRFSSSPERPVQEAVSEAASEE